VYTKILNRNYQSTMTNTKPIFTEYEKTYLARFFGGRLPQPSTAFEARVILEQVAASMNVEDPEERLAGAGFIEWANELDPRPSLGNRTCH
jgi:hypothetical protein